MAFQFKFRATVDAEQKNIDITDITAIGGSGWGSPNPTPAEVTASSLELTTPSATTFDLSGSIITVDLFAKGFPVTSSVTVSNVDLGLSSSDTLPDGIYEAYVDVDYTTVDGQGDSSWTQELILIDNVECCISTATAKSCTCNKTKSLEIFEANITLNAIEYACSTEEQAALIAYTTEACENKFCKNCQ